MDYKHNFVVFGNGSDYLRAAYADLIEHPQTDYIDDISIKCKLIKWVYRYHTSPRLNSKVKLPFRRIWNKFSFNSEFENSLPICFIFFGNDLRRIGSGFIEYLRKKYPNCSVIAYCQDLVRTYGKEFERNRNKYDLVFSFDQEDAKKYNMIYQPLVYSKNVEVDISDNCYNSDVYFLGKAKDRLDSIIAAYTLLSNMGLKCNFYIVGVKKENQIMADNIHYCEGLSYDENIKNVLKTKCLLEIMQGEGHGYTLRCAEALTYRKKLLTNNQEVLSASFYDKSFIYVVENFNNAVDGCFFETPVDINEKEAKMLSPLNFLRRIDNLI